MSGDQLLTAINHSSNYSWNIFWISYWGPTIGNASVRCDSQRRSYKECATKSTGENCDAFKREFWLCFTQEFKSNLLLKCSADRSSQECKEFFQENGNNDVVKKILHSNLNEVYSSPKRDESLVKCMKESNDGFQCLVRRNPHEVTKLEECLSTSKFYETKDISKCEKEIQSLMSATANTMRMGGLRIGLL